MSRSSEELRRRYLAAMGIEVWEGRARHPVPPQPPLAPQGPAAVPAPMAARPTPPPPQAHPPSGEATELQWRALRARVAACEACELHRTRTQTVFGVGDPQAELMVIGEAPGVEEDRRGEPFVGQAGRLLTAMLGAIGLRREQVYIANILKCHPPDNRDPRAEEAQHCSQFLLAQMELVRPRLILAVGRIAAQNLLKSASSLTRLRGKVYAFGPREIPTLVTYHPAYLLRTPRDKAKAWDDLRRVRRMLEQLEV